MGCICIIYGLSMGRKKHFKLEMLEKLQNNQTLEWDSGVLEGI